MRFKLDENMPVEAADVLRAAGHVADTVYEEQLAGHADPEIASACQLEKRTLITQDLDFADIRVYPPDQYAGLIVLRSRSQAKPHVLSLLTRLTAQFAIQPLDKTLWIVDESGIRIRGVADGD
jgi:predicted nuclease of predicted toxin-antitoxin system